jgi:superfamily I DNA and RNA helicase
MLETVIGIKRDLFGTDALIEALASQPWTGTLYIGYPVVPLPDGPTAVDALLTCRERGLVVFDIHTGGAPTTENIRARQDALFAALSSTLIGSTHLVVNRALIVTINIVTIIPEGIYVENDSLPSSASEPLLIATPGKILEVLAKCDEIDMATLRKINAGIQRIGGSRPVRHRSDGVKHPNSRGAKLQQIEREIANLDQWQKAAAIEMPKGPQRIRGLAGSGKTVVLALKAAYLHAREPEWRIALTFHTRTLYEQLRELVGRFYYEHTRQQPNWDKLQILHTWGARDRQGVYRRLAEHLGASPKDWRQAKQLYGSSASFEGLCRELIVLMNEREFSSLYDVVLIDEAQDLPGAFFEMIYMATEHPKRIVWAYDELQNLSEDQMASSSTLFGKDKNGEPRIPGLFNTPGSPKTDVILPVCYRNTPWALTVAHALGFGVYREGDSTSLGGSANRGSNLVQFFDDPVLWQEIGYEVLKGDIAPGRAVTLARSNDASPKFFERLLDPSDAVRCEVFANEKEQLEWVAEQIHINLTNDELQPRDILIVGVAPFMREAHAIPIVRALHKHGVKSHFAGKGKGGKDELYGSNDSIPIASIYRAKGNEAAMVYILFAEHGAAPFELIKRRNILFTAVTRSRAWVRLCGCGIGMESIKKEVDQVVAHQYQLELTVPTPEQLKRMRNIHRDMTMDDKARVKKGRAGLAMLAELANADEAVFQAVLAAVPAEDRDRVWDALRSLSLKEN